VSVAVTRTVVTNQACPAERLTADPQGPIIGTRPLEQRRIATVDAELTSQLLWAPRVLDGDHHGPTAGVIAGEVLSVRRFVRRVPAWRLQSEA
jgi:hypothetical protein